MTGTTSQEVGPANCHKETGVLRQIVFIALIVAFWCQTVLSASTPPASPPVETGAGVLARTRFEVLRGKKFGLITNQSATVDGTHLIALMQSNGVAPSIIFSPEHGLKGAAEDGERLKDDSYSGIGVKSLYGDIKKPRREDLAGLDLLVFDIQDVGVRYYTFISTMGLAMQSAAEAGLPFLVLDRPNPIGGDYVAGFVRDKAHATFTSLYPIPEVHGLTIGELAEMIKGEAMLPGLEKLHLSVIKMEGWQRWMRWPDTGLPWVATSPNLATFESTLLYPGTGLLEGTAASEGRGTELPFRVLGWPGINGARLAQRLNDQQLPGLRFDPIRYTPASLPGVSSAPKYRGREVGGVEIKIIDYKKVLPVEAGLAIIATLYQEVPTPERIRFFTGGFVDMAGSDTPIREAESGMTLGALIAGWGDDYRHFCAVRPKYLLY